MSHFIIACVLFSQLTSEIEQGDNATKAGQDIAPAVGSEDATPANSDSAPIGGTVLDRRRRRTREPTNPDPAPVVPEGPPRKQLTADDVLRMPEQTFNADGTLYDHGKPLEERPISLTNERSHVEPKQPRSTSYFSYIAIAFGIVLAIICPRRRRTDQ